ncbi:MAG: hypothetical protein U0L88_05230 [Acutalibacteraceae bacterium]|nr:hypothetical protein [Acutalibacteraceae bacterium]
MRDVVYQCNECEEPIRESDFYYVVKGDCYCTNCVERNYYKAEKENNNITEDDF